MAIAPVLFFSLELPDTIVSNVQRLLLILFYLLMLARELKRNVSIAHTDAHLY